MLRAGSVLSVFILAGGIPLESAAQAYPERPIRMLIPQPPGGTMDTIARQLIDVMVPALGQNVVIDNRSGANGVIAAGMLAGATPDGYTLLYTSASLANNELARTNLPVQILRDFAPITRATSLPGYLILVNPKLKVKTVKDLIELSKDERNPVHFGSSGIGNSQHLLGELLNARTGAKLQHVPYRGFALIVNAVIGNEIQVAFGSPTTVVPHIKAGRIKALAYTGKNRFARLPSLPTVAESGLPGFVYAASWHGVFAPAKTPRNVIMHMQGAIAKAVHSARIGKVLQLGGHMAVGSTPEVFRKFLEGYLKDTAELFRIAGIKKRSGAAAGRN
jgi:tripartite-type tricarboxylate transporter receptor subunit TctC